MRQTSRAVALLLALESANAAPVQTKNYPAGAADVAFNTNAFNPVASAEGAPTPTLQLNSRTAGYLNQNPTALPIVPGAQWDAATYKKGQIGATAGADTTTVGSGCMSCLNGGGVWCSRTFSYLSTSATFQNDNTANSGVMSTLTTSPSGGAALDGGSCCEAVDKMTKFVQTMQGGYDTTAHTALNNTQSKAGAGNTATLVNQSCVAVASTNDYSSGGAEFFGIREIDAGTKANSGWWCSNGLYKTVKDTSDAASSIILNAQQIIPNGQNKRLELAQVGCPNAKTMCGYDYNGTVQQTDPSKITVAQELKAINDSWVIPMPQSATGFLLGSKCTWVAYSTVSGPSFVLQNSLLGNKIGIVTSNWQIHAMEYTASTTTSFDPSNGSLVPAAGLNGIMTEKEALSNPKSLVPLFTMPAEQFATLRTWYGEGTMAVDTISGQSGAWLSPGRAELSNLPEVSEQLAATKSQLYGNVANIPVSNYTGSKDKVPLGDVNFGTYNSVAFDLRQVRYMPAKVAQTNWTAGTAALATYNNALSSYNTAKTTWDNYVAILEKNAAQDAFAALFSPPKAPTVPPLPNKPWLPAAYSGYVRATQLELVSWNANVTVQSKVASPTAQQFWTNLTAAQTVGGWGSFTAQIFTFRKGWGKSFGTIGYSGDADNVNMSDVWNYKWACAVDQTKTMSLPAGSQCAPTYTVQTNGQLATAQNTTSANQVKMITAVSLWSTSNKFTDTSGNNANWTVNDFQLTFYAKAWNSQIVNLKPIAAPVKADDAKSLTGLAGAQALVASSAAALAVAAALY